MEREAIGLAGNITGRTAWDRAVTTGWNPGHIIILNETLRASFMKDSWDPEHCEPYSIFVSQGDYPLKGLHYLLKAGFATDPGEISPVQVYVAGNDLTAYRTSKEKLKISAYGSILRRLIREGQLEDWCISRKN